MRIIEEHQLDFNDLLIQPRRSPLNSRSEVSLFRTFEWTGIHGKANSLNCIPIIAANMASVGTPKMAKLLAKRGYLCALEKHIPVWDLERLYDELEELARKSKKPMNTYTQRIMPTVGLNDCTTQLDKLAENHEVKCICIDIPNGYVPSFTSRVQQIAGQHPDALIFAGNVVTGDISQDLVLARRCNSIHHTGKVGMCTKVGIGSGSACLTRLKTGVGRPQASAVIECADACHQVNGLCCSDGGCCTPADIAKAFGCGADFVMLGGMLAGCEEAAGKVVYINDKPHKEFYGMSSNLAQERHFGGRRPSSTSEGREKYIPVTGTLDEMLDDIEGGLKSACCYIGARELKNFPKCCTFYKVSNQLNMKFAGCNNIKY